MREQSKQTSNLNINFFILFPWILLLHSKKQRKLNLYFKYKTYKTPEWIMIENLFPSTILFNFVLKYHLLWEKLLPDNSHINNADNVDKNYSDRCRLQLHCQLSQVLLTKKMMKIHLQQGFLLNLGIPSSK